MSEDFTLCEKCLNKYAMFIKRNIENNSDYDIPVCKVTEDCSENCGEPQNAEKKA